MLFPIEEINVIKQVKKFCLDNKLVSEGDRVIIACSGGSDSLAMLDIFLTLRESLGIRVAAAHYEHGHLCQQPQLYHGRCAGTGH